MSKLKLSPGLWFRDSETYSECLNYNWLGQQHRQYPKKTQYLKDSLTTGPHSNLRKKLTTIMMEHILTKLQ